MISDKDAERLGEIDLSKITTRKRHLEIDTGAPVGNEFPRSLPKDEQYSNPFAPTRYRR